MLVTDVPPPPAEIRLLTVLDRALCAEFRFDKPAAVTLSASLTMDATLLAALATDSALLAALLMTLQCDRRLLISFETTFDKTECAWLSTLWACESTECNCESEFRRVSTDVTARDNTLRAAAAVALTAESSLLVTLVPPPPAEIRLLTVFERALWSDVRFETVAFVTLRALLTMLAALLAAFATLRMLDASVLVTEPDPPVALLALTRLLRTLCAEIRFDKLAPVTLRALETIETALLTVLTLASTDVAAAEAVFA